MNNALSDFYRCPEELVPISSPQEGEGRPGYFRFGVDSVYFGRSAESVAAYPDGVPLPDLSQRVQSCGSRLQLPFNPSEILDTLRLERYPANSRGILKTLLSTELARDAYYYLRPVLGESLRKRLQRLFFRDWSELVFPAWPVDTSVEQMLEQLLVLSMRAGKQEKLPFIWFWPDGALSAAMLTHDVETAAGLALVPDLMDVDDSFGIKASYQLVPEQRYSLPASLLDAIRRRQCEINVHGFNHEGNLFRDRSSFLEQAKWINHYVEDFAAQGFRSACMYRNLDWYNELNISYDMSVPNVAHLEPQRGGCCTVFPYFVEDVLELPLTTIQDYSLFHILGDYSIDLWKKQTELITDKHGLLSFIVHPDYIFSQTALAVYKDLLGYLSQLRSERQLWIARPGDINGWWRARSAMNLVLEDGKWCIQGTAREHARIAFARLAGDRISYSLEDSFEAPAEEAVAVPVRPLRSSSSRRINGTLVS